MTSTTTAGTSGPGSNGNEDLLHTPQNYGSGASPTDTV